MMEAGTAGVAKYWDGVVMTPKLALCLRNYKAEMGCLYWQLGRRFSLDDLAFSSVAGEPIDPGVVSHTFARIVIQAGLKNIRFHDMRQTFASLMFLLGAK